MYYFLFFIFLFCEVMGDPKTKTKNREEIWLRLHPQK
ncbi:hypothetical protein GLYMA_07G113301v4 [Glycine max]|nr:hypothetical protein GLYMA_07G113301v4 [Glycine max]KAH1086385.1 hypothetical protein GYH30_018073 [Glycine max]